MNVACKTDDLPSRFREFFDYLMTQNPTGTLTSRIAKSVRKVASNEKWRLEYMTLQMKYNEIREEALKEGREEGRAEGKAEGKAEGRLSLIEVLKAFRSGKDEKVLLEEGFDPESIALAKEYLAEE